MAYSFLRACLWLESISMETRTSVSGVFTCKRVKGNEIYHVLRHEKNKNSFFDTEKKNVATDIVTLDCPIAPTNL